MQGTELLRDPGFANTLEQSPFQAKDLPGLSSAVADTFDRLGTDQRKELKKAVDELDDMSEEDLLSFLRLISYVEQNPDQYPKLVKQLAETGAFDPADIPQQYDAKLIAVIKSLVGQALNNVRARSQKGFAKGGIASLKKQADKVAAAGRGGDTILAHINPMEAEMLKRMGGRGSINPKTGLPEFGFWKSLGNILKIGAKIVGTIALSVMGVPPIFAGAIVGGASALLSGAKPVDALKSALIGGAMAGIGSGISSSLGGGSFFDGVSNGFTSSGSLPGSETFKNIFGGSNLLGGASEAGAATGSAAANAATENMPLPVPRASDAAIDAWGKASEAAYNAANPVAPQVGVKSLFDSATNWVKDNKMTALLGGGALLLGMGQKKEDIKPTLTSGKTGTDLLNESPSVYGFNAANFAQAAPKSPNPVFPGGGYIAPTTGIAPLRPPSFAQVQFDQPDFSRFGIKNVRTGGAINGPGTGTSDSIPARLSDGEFVMTAKAVRGAGKGDRMEGARKMYELMHKFERMA